MRRGFERARPQGKRKLILVAATAVAILLATASCFGSLGAGADSIESDRAHMKGMHTVIPHAAYTRHEIQSPTGLVVNEYVSPSGRVFAVTWRGPWMPDLRQLLGTYFDQFVQAARAQSQQFAGRHPLVIQNPGLVVVVAGHPRWFTGSAYVPGFVPAGIRAEGLR